MNEQSLQPGEAGPRPDERLPVRVARSVLAGQSGVLAVLAIAGFAYTSDIPFTARSDDTVLGLGVNGLHSTVLAAAAVLGATAAFGTLPWLRRWVGLQAVGFTTLLVVATTVPVAAAARAGMNLNGPDHLLHGMLALLGFLGLLQVSTVLGRRGHYSHAAGP